MRANVTMIRAALVLVAAGVALLLVSHGTTARAAAIALLGVAGVLLVSAAFLAIGQSEERAREAERRTGTSAGL